MYSKETTQRFNHRPLIQMYNTAINGMSNKTDPVNETLQDLMGKYPYLTEFKKLGEVKKAVEGMRDAAIERMDVNEPILFRGNQLALAMVNAAYKTNANRRLGTIVVIKAKKMVSE